MTADDAIIVEQWHAIPSYRCRRCGYATLNADEIAMHVAAHDAPAEPGPVPEPPPTHTTVAAETPRATPFETTRRRLLARGEVKEIDHAE